MPEKERVVRIKPERTRKGLSHIGADLTDAERKDRAQRQLEQMEESIKRSTAILEKEHKERLNEWANEFLRAKGSVANLDRSELSRILADAILHYDYLTVGEIKEVIASDPELMKDLGLDQYVNPVPTTGGWKRMKSGDAARGMGIGSTTLGVWKTKHPDRVKSAGHGWCLVNPEYLRE